MSEQQPARTTRQRALALVDSQAFQNTVVVVILVNAVSLGLATSPTIVDQYAALLRVFEVCVLVVFGVEMAIRLYAKRWDFFRNPWNWLDLIVVVLAMLPATRFFSVLRVLRLLRLARLVSTVPSMRRVVAALVNAVPGIASVVAMLLVVLYSGAVLGVQMFRSVAPDTFGSLDRALYTMFELLTVTGWQNTADPIVAARPSAWVFFVVYIVVTAFILLNLLVGVVVGAMQTEVNRTRWSKDQVVERHQHEEVMAELRELRELVTAMRARQDPPERLDADADG